MIPPKQIDNRCLIYNKTNKGKSSNKNQISKQFNMMYTIDKTKYITFFKESIKCKLVIDKKNIE